MVDGIFNREQLVQVAVYLGAVEVCAHRGVELAAATNEFRAKRLKTVAAVAQWERSNAGCGGPQGLKFRGKVGRHTPKVTLRGSAQFATMPSRRRMIRFARWAMSSSWVTTTRVLPAW